MSNVDRFLDARHKRDQARVMMNDLAARLRQIATQLAHPEEGIGIRGEQYFLPTPQSDVTLKHTDYPSWDQIERAVENYRQADEALADLELKLTPQERNLLDL